MSESKVRLPNILITMLQEKGNHIQDHDDKMYFNLPFWYRETEEKNIFIQLDPNNLPECIIEFINENLNSIRHVPYQKCPKCNGQGSISKPPYVPAGVTDWVANQSSYICDVCNGDKIIPMKEIIPNQL